MKKWILLAFALLLFTLPACAEGLPLVVDDAALLSADAVGSLSAEAQKLSDAYKMDVVILTTKSLGQKEPGDYAADFYDYTGYGQGEDHDGVLLMLAMESRDWYILTTGRGIKVFNDYGIDAISGDIVHYFSDGYFATGFARFLRDAEIFLKQAEIGEPFSANNPVQLETTEAQGGDLP